MDRDVAKQSRPGAAHRDNDAAVDGVGKATLTGRLAGDHAPVASPAPAAPTAAPAAAPAKGALSITSATEAKAPAGANSRTTVGVGEVVSFTGSEAGDWTTTGGKVLSDTNTESFRWSAPASPGSYVITLTVGDRKATKTMVVLAPNAIYFKKVGDIAPPSGQGAGMTLNMDIGPKTVSFGAVQIKEKPGPASGVWGYFEKKQKTGANLAHQPKASWTYILPDNTTERPDEAYFDGWAAPWEPGGLTWIIPNVWSLFDEGGEGAELALVTQTMHIADTKGSSVVTKGGQSAARNASK
ncbi:MAG TPA: hypothetical protein VK427_00145 [Kofleriaceae bacterium]|nr:hypothetical protein [Kofleriaceae bacterium]